MTTFCNWLSLHFISHKLASFQSMSCIRLILRSFSHPCDLCFQFRGLQRNHSENQWYFFSWLCVNSVSFLFKVRGSMWLHQIDFFVDRVSDDFCFQFCGVRRNLFDNDDFSQLTVSAFRSTSVGSASVNVPASNWFAVDRVFLMTFVSSFLTSVGLSLTNSGNILQLNVRAFLRTSDNIVSVSVPASDCLCVDWVILVSFGSSFVMYIGISLTSSDNVLADFAGFRYHFCFKCVVQCTCMKLIFCGLRFSVFFCCYIHWFSKESHWQAMMFCSWLSVYFVPLQLVALQSLSQNRIELLWIVSFWWFFFQILWFTY